jgi:hypothetical protein
MLETAQSLPAAESEGLERQASGGASARPQSTETLSKQNSRSAPISPFEMEMGDSNLENALQHRPHGALGLMPQLLEAIVAGVPLRPVEQVHGPLKTGIVLQELLLIQWKVRIA